MHTDHSHDGHCSIGEAIRAAKAKKLDGIAITDHDELSASAEARGLSSDGFLLIPGVEVSSSEGHILGLGVHEPIPKKLSAAETVERIRGQGGVAVAAHPFKLGQNPNLVHRARFDAIEVLNSRALLLANQLARRFAERNGLAMSAGSDAHFADEIGLAYVNLNCEPDAESVLKEIRKGRASPSGRALPLPSLLRGILRQFLSQQ